MRRTIQSNEAIPGRRAARREGCLPKGNGPDIKEDPAKGFSPAFCRCLAPCARLRMTTSEKERSGLDFATTSSPTDHRAIKNGSLDLLRGPAPGAFVGGHGAVGDFHYRIT